MARADGCRASTLGLVIPNPAFHSADVLAWPFATAVQLNVDATTREPGLTGSGYVRRIVQPRCRPLRQRNAGALFAGGGDLVVRPALQPQPSPRPGFRGP